MLTFVLALSLGCTRAAADLLDTGKSGPAVVVADDDPKSGELVEVINLPEDQAGLISALADADNAAQAVTKLAAMGNVAVPALRDTALHGKDITARGWAIQALSQIEGEEADTALLGIQDYGQAPELVRTWAAAARINRTQSVDEVLAFAPLAQTWPALNRPIQLKVESLASELSDPGAAIAAVQLNPNLATIMAPIILGGGADPLLEVMLHHENTEVRRMAAAYLGSWAGSDNKNAMDIAKGYAYTPGAEAVLWEGGALYVPSIAWRKKEAQVLAGHLVSWHLYCDLQGLFNEKNQIFNNIQSINLHQAAGWPGWPSTDTNELLVQYGQAAGKDALQKVLSEHGVADDEKYVKLMKQVR